MKALAGGPEDDWLADEGGTIEPLQADSDSASEAQKIE